MMESSSAVKHTFPSSSNKTKHEQKKVLAPNGALTAEEEKRLSLSRFCLCHLKYPKRHGQQRVHFVSGLITAVSRHYILLPQPPPRTEHPNIASPHRESRERRRISTERRRRRPNVIFSRVKARSTSVTFVQQKKKTKETLFPIDVIAFTSFLTIYFWLHAICFVQERTVCVVSNKATAGRFIIFLFFLRWCAPRSLLSLLFCCRYLNELFVFFGRAIQTMRWEGRWDGWWWWT